MKNVQYRDLGTIDYKECWELQTAIFDTLVTAKTAGAAERQNHDKETATGQKNECRPTLLLCEHPHVYTLGKSGAEGNMLMSGDFLKSVGAAYYRIDRGGDVTYHGPGQLVGYPILDLDGLGVGLKEYIHLLEQAVIETVADFGIAGGRSDGATGVWLPADATGGLRKICAIGVRSSRFVTMHGFALNVNPHLEYFNHINPCGFTDRGVTSMERELGGKVAMDEVKKSFLKHFVAVFGVKWFEAETEN